MNVVEPITISQLGEASQADLTDQTLAIVSVPDSSTPSGYASKKSLLSRLKEFFLGSTSISGIGDGTVTGAISSLNSDLTRTSASVSKVSTFGATTFSCVAFKYKGFAIIYFNIAFPAIASGTETQMCVLPTGYRPVQKFNINGCTQQAAPVGLLLQFYTDGKVSVLPSGAITAGAFFRGTFAIPTA